VDKVVCIPLLPICGTLGWNDRQRPDIHGFNLGATLYTGAVRRLRRPSGVFMPPLTSWPTHDPSSVLYI